MTPLKGRVPQQNVTNPFTKLHSMKAPLAIRRLEDPPKKVAEIPFSPPFNTCLQYKYWLEYLKLHSKNRYEDFFAWTWVWWLFAQKENKSSVTRSILVKRRVALLKGLHCMSHLLLQVIKWVSQELSPCNKMWKHVRLLAFIRRRKSGQENKEMRCSREDLKANSSSWRLTRG